MYFGRVGGVPPVVKNLIIINVLMLLATYVFSYTMNIDLNQLFGLYYFKSEYFKPFQFVTHMFMHGGFMHLFFNMFALWMFGKVLESVWGSKRFFVYYMVTGLGAAALHTLVNHIQLTGLLNASEAFFNTPTPEGFYSIITHHFANYSNSIVDFYNSWNENPESPEYIAQGTDYIRGLVYGSETYKLQGALNIPTVGASGAVFGVLLAFGMLFPNTQIMLLIPPIPIKAKYFVMIYGGIELYLGITQPGSNVAHFAHLGGMIFGFILIKYWQKRMKHFY